MGAKRSSSFSQIARVCSLPMPVSTMVQPPSSCSSQRLMWSSANGSGMLSQWIPGATSSVVPASGVCGHGYWSGDKDESAAKISPHPIMETERAEFSISELAQEFDVTPRAIRFYEDQGLLAPRRDGQRRIYTPRDRTRLKLTLRGKRLGLTLAEIRELIDMYEPGRDDAAQLERFREVLEAHRKSLLQQRADIEDQLSEIQTFGKRIHQQLKKRR